MFINHPSALCVAVKYTHTKNNVFDFSNEPRPLHNFMFMLEGESVVTTPNGTLKIKKGDFLYIPKGSTYISQWIANPNCVYHTVHFNLLQKDEPFVGKKADVQWIDSINFNECYDLVKTIDLYQNENSPRCFNALSAFYKLCSKIFPLVKVSDQKQNENPITPAINYLENNRIATVKVEDLADLCFLSPSRFYYLFKYHTGCSPIEYKNKLLIRQASQSLLFEKNKSIEEISNEFGFDSPIYFRRVFKKLTGKTPTEYRNDGEFI